MIRRRSIAAVAAIATLMLLAGAGTAAASWNTAASLSATASSTTIGTTLARSGQLDTSYRYSGSTSTTATGALTITNSGGAPLTYGLAAQTTGSATLAQKTALILWTGTCGSTIPATGAVTTTLADRAPALPAAAKTLAPGASVTVCVATRITGSDASSTNTALQGQTVSTAFSITGAVGTSWTTTASATALTQSVYQLQAVSAVTCSNRSGGVTISWNAPANRAAGESVSYRVVDVASGVTVATGATANATASVNLGTGSFWNGTYTLAVEATEATSGTTAPVSATVSVRRSSVLIFFPTLECA